MAARRWMRVDSARPVAVTGRVGGHWVWDGEAWSVPLRVERLAQGTAVQLAGGEPLRLSLPGPAPPPPFGSRLRVRGYLRRSSGFANAIPVDPGPWRLRLESRRLLAVVAPPGRLESLAAGLRRRVEAALHRAVHARTSTDRRREGRRRGSGRRPSAGIALGRPGRTGPPGGGIGDAVVEESGSRLAAPGDCESVAEALDPSELSPGPALVRALLLGDAGAVPPRWRRGLRRTGLVHVLAVSGLHVGLVAAAALLVTAPLGVRPRLLAALAAVGLYLLVAGPRPALLRASLMALLAAAALLLGRPPLAGNALAVTVAVLVLARPAVVDDLGFRLTASATAGLVFLAPRLAAALRRGVAGLGGTAAGRPVAALVVPLSASLSAQLAAAPFALPAFHLVCATSPLDQPAGGAVDGALPGGRRGVDGPGAGAAGGGGAPGAVARRPGGAVRLAGGGWAGGVGRGAGGGAGVDVLGAGGDDGGGVVPGRSGAGRLAADGRGGDGGVGGEGSGGDQRATERTLEGGSLRLPRGATARAPQTGPVPLPRSRRPRPSPPRPPRLRLRGACPSPPRPKERGPWASPLNVGFADRRKEADCRRGSAVSPC